MEPEGKRASLSDIAKEAGVDASTVSLVLNRKPLAERLRPETRRRIIEIAEKLRYRRLRRHGVCARGAAA